MQLVNRVKQTVALTVLVLSFGGCSWAPGHFMDDDTLASSEKAGDVSMKLQPITPQLILQEEKNRPPVIVPKELLDYQPSSYVIGPSDVLYVTVWDHPELTVPSGNQQQIESNGRLVRPNGEFFFPYIGNIKAAGMTIEGLAAYMTKALATYIDKPQLDVAVIRYSSQRVYLSGAFQNAAPVVLNSKPTTLAEVLGTSGELGINADNDSRVTGDLSRLKFTRDGHEYLLNIYAINKESDYTSRIYMKNGDTLHLDYNDQKRVYMMGEVKAPVALRFHADTISLTDALTTVGGLDERAANGESVYVIRGQNGDFKKETAQIYRLDARSPTSFILANRFMLHPQDVVYVGPTDLERWNRVVAQLLPTLDLINATTTDALQVKDVKNAYSGD